MSAIGKLVGSVLGPITGASQQADAAVNAANIQAGAADKGIAAQQEQFAALQKLLAPYVQAGTGALTGQQNLIGLNGADAQTAAINGIQSGPQFKAMLDQGENSILANASATGGLRGGNVQGALGQFSPMLLSQLIQQQYSNLGGLAGMGANAAAGVGQAGLQTGANTANLLQQQGAAQAGGTLAAGNLNSNIFGTLMQGLGAYADLGGFRSAPNVGSAGPGTSGIRF